MEKRAIYSFLDILNFVIRKLGCFWFDVSWGNYILIIISTFVSMLPLNQDLQLKKNSLNEFIELCKRVLDYIPNVISGKEEKGNYVINNSIIAGTKKYVRPVNKLLFFSTSAEINNIENQFRSLLMKIKLRKENLSNEEELIIDKFLYTLIQSIGIGLDLLVDPNSSRKHVGNRFEELMRCVFTELGIHNKKAIFRIPYETPEGTKNYVCENDLILSPTEELLKFKDVQKEEIIVSVKTTSKDRMSKMFIDKILLEKFSGHQLKVIGIFLNDVQRKEHNNISFTLVSGLFMVYNQFLTEMEGVYYLDPPPNALIKPYSKHIKPFSKLLTEDITRILAS